MQNSGDPRREVRSVRLEFPAAQRLFKRQLPVHAGVDRIGLILSLIHILSDFDEQKFIKTLIAAKLIMMLGLSLFGKTLSISFTRPVYLILAVAILAALYLISCLLYTSGRSRPTWRSV